MVDNSDLATPARCRLGGRLKSVFGLLALLLPNALFYFGGALSGQPLLLGYAPSFHYVMSHAEKTSGIVALAEPVLAGYAVITAFTFLLYQKEIVAKQLDDQRRNEKALGLDQTRNKIIGLAALMLAGALLIPPTFHATPDGQVLILLLLCLFTATYFSLTSLVYWLADPKSRL